MTEERIKKLAEMIHEDYVFDDFGQQDRSLRITADLIRTVAAEAREEGIEEIVNYVRKWDDAGPKYIYVGDIYKTAKRLKTERKR